MPVRQHARAELHDGCLKFDAEDGCADALSRGVFYLRAPSDLDLAAGEKLATSYFLAPTGGPDDAYRGFRTSDLEDSALVYSDTGEELVDVLQLERPLWEQHLPAAVRPTLHHLDALARKLVHSLLERCGVPAADTAQVTGGLDEGGALEYGLFVNATRGSADAFAPHKHAGFVQLLHVSQDCLETWEDGAWSSVQPVPGHLVVLIGYALEVLTAGLPARATAAYQRTADFRRTARVADGHLFGVSVGPPFEQDLYQYEGPGRLTTFRPALSFQQRKATEGDLAPPNPPRPRR